LLRRDIARQGGSTQIDHETDMDPCPLEFVSNIFSPADQAFVQGLDSPYLKELFRRERRAVALCWIQQTATTAKHIVGEHLRASSRQADLVFATEVRILLRYLQIRTLCSALALSLRFTSPERVRALATYADGLSQRLSAAQRAFLIAAEMREPQRSPAP
jgi:hypothetical protein